MTDPVAALRAVDTLLLGALPDARAIQDEGQEKHRLALGLIAAETQAAKGTEAGCVAALTALAAVQDEAANLDGVKSPHVIRCAKAAEQAYAAARAIVWHVKPPVPVLTVQGFASVSPGGTAVATLALSAKAAGPVTVAYSATGLPSGSVVIPAGADTFPVSLAFPAAQITANVPGTFRVLTAAGATIGTPGGFGFVLLHNSSPLPTVALAGPGDITPSATTRTAAQAVVTLSAPTDHDVTATYALTGQQDGDLASPATGPVIIPAGAASATIPVLAAPLALLADRPPITLALTNVAGAQNTPAPVTFVLKANTVVTKGTLTFTTPIGTVLRDPAAEKIVMVEVAREGVSTHEAATIPVVDITLPAAILKAVGPAVFGAGQRLGNAPMVLHPYGTSARAAPVARTPGRADLLATAQFNLGALASQDFVVQDGQEQGGANPFQARLPAGTTPMPWLVDGWSMNWDTSDLEAYVAAVGRRPAVCSGGSHNGGRTASWAGVAGGAPSGNHADYDDFSRIGGGNQFDVPGTNAGVAFQVIQPGKGYVVPTWRSVPDNVAASDWADVAAGKYDDFLYAMGRRAWALMRHYGLSSWQLCTRFNKEYNGGGYAVSPATAASYGKAMARQITAFNNGYLDGGAPTKPFHVLGLARHDQIGPLEAMVPVDGAGKALVDGIDISMHPPSSLNALAGKPFDVQVAGVRAWIRGQYDPRPCYAPDHSDPKYSGLAVARAHGIVITNFETSPRQDGALACTISAAAWQALHDFWAENAAMVGGVGVFQHTVIEKGWAGAPPGWGDGVDKYVQLWRG